MMYITYENTDNNESAIISNVFIVNMNEGVLVVEAKGTRRIFRSGICRVFHTETNAEIKIFDLGE